MSKYDFDLFVIGAGSGGVRAARIAAMHGARVGICEEFRYGGTCVIRGCVPKKLLVYASHFSEDFEDAEGFGWTVGPREFSWPALVAPRSRKYPGSRASISGCWRSSASSISATGAYWWIHTRFRWAIVL